MWLHCGQEDGEKIARWCWGFQVYQKRKKDITHWHKKAANSTYRSSLCVQAKSVPSPCERMKEPAMASENLWDNRIFKGKLGRCHGVVVGEITVRKTICPQGLYSCWRGQTGTSSRAGQDRPTPGAAPWAQLDTVQARCAKPSQFKGNFCFIMFQFLKRNLFITHCFSGQQVKGTQNYEQIQSATTSAFTWHLSHLSINYLAFSPCFSESFL